MRKKQSLKFMFLISFFLVLAACSSQNEEVNEPKDKEENTTVENRENTKGESSQNEDQIKVLNTKNVTRIDADEVKEAAIMVSQTIWPATHKENRPGTVILSPLENWQIPLAAADLIHHPNNGPILFIENNEIPDKTMKELIRLAPTGNIDGTEVMVMGDVSENVLNQLKDYKVQQIKGNDIAEFARDVDKIYADAAGKLPEGVIIASLEEEAKLYSLIAANWISHMPEPVLFVTKDGIPEATKEALSLRNNHANIYVLGPESVISEELYSELQQYGKVTRIAGEGPVETSIEFAKFKDKNTGFGWGIKKPGAGLLFISTNDADFAMAGAPFAHLGKHAPLIWLEDGKLADATHDYILELQPKFKNDPTVGPFNHAYILGSTEAVSMENQGMIDLMLEISPEHGGGHGDH